MVPAKADRGVRGTGFLKQKKTSVVLVFLKASPGGIEPSHLASEANALSAELRGHL